jgi:hypothetical protein
MAGESIFKYITLPSEDAAKFVPPFDAPEASFQ